MMKQQKCRSKHICIWPTQVLLISTLKKNACDNLQKKKKKIQMFMWVYCVKQLEFYFGRQNSEKCEF